MKMSELTVHTLGDLGGAVARLNQDIATLGTQCC
jgi:hypothetical protein